MSGRSGRAPDPNIVPELCCPLSVMLSLGRADSVRRPRRARPPDLKLCQGSLTRTMLSGHPDSMSVEKLPADLVGQVTNKDPALGLQAVVALRRLLEELERLHVDNARDQGWTWQSIATALQVSRQSVHEKHATRRKTTGKGD
jgi:hypothetical protein